ncbi:MAG: M48 family metallopeptidase, partial [Bacteroidia bacterium]
IKKEDEPELFNFIYKVADEAKAPRPHKIFLSNTVNACVFYDISFINLFFPTRKNLEIGLGLVNVLNLGEFKSILAHEFGHFTQRSMIVGRWVYIAHQVVYQIVSKRDGFDKFINGLSRVDIRIAWVGWLLSIIVWSIRSFAEIFFKLVILTQRALSREMEFHADLVAVSLTGSDAIINSLHKLTPADDAYENAIAFLNRQLKNKKKIADIYSLQENAITQMRVVLNNPEYGASPAQSQMSGQRLTVFKEQIAQTPKMWSTHPSNVDREKNAKKIYIPANIDSRSSWILFKNPEKTKEKLTHELFKTIKIETSPLSKEESLEIQNKEFQRSFLLPKYRGIYLGNYPHLSFKSVSDIYNSSTTIQNLGEKFAELYPPELQQQLEQLKNLDEEILMLEGLNKRTLTANEGKIKHRGRYISMKELPAIIVQVKKEAKVERDKIDLHIKQCRVAHYQAAKNIAAGWDDYLFSLTTLVHYCEHTHKNIEELSKFFYETLDVVSSKRNRGHSDLQPLYRAANDLHFALQGVFSYGKSVRLSPPIIEKLNGKKFGDLLEPFTLTEANQSNINSWVNVVGSWVNLALEALNTLRLAALDELLQSENYIEKIYSSQNAHAEPAPEPVGISDTYAKYDPAVKKEVIKLTDIYSRFHKADGVFSSIAKFSVACLIIFSGVFFTTTIGTSKIVVYNGFSQDVLVNIDGDQQLVRKGNTVEISVDDVPELNIKAKTINGELIESFRQKIEQSSRTYVYNVAGAAIIYTWAAYYGYAAPEENHEMFGAQRWLDINADDYFTDPPETVSLEAGQTSSRTVVAEYKGAPSLLLEQINNEEDKNNFIRVHALWEDSSSPDLLIWLSAAASLKDFNTIIEKRLQANPMEIVSLRTQQDVAKGNDKLKICEEQKKLYFKNPRNPDLYYLSCRCQGTDAQKDSAFFEGHKKWPENGWLAYASGFTYEQQEKWEDALSCFDTVFKYVPALRISITTEIKRISKLVGKDFSIASADLVDPYLTSVAEVEDSYEGDQKNKLYAFKLLEEGKLEDALNYCNTDTTLYGDLIRLAAVSEGATPSIIDKAIALKNNKINQLTIIPAVAFTIKRHLPLTADLKDVLKISFDDKVDT